MTAATAPFRHEALLYAGDDEFVSRISAFVADGVRKREEALVVVSSHKIDRLRRTLGDAASSVRFADMAEVGQNPSLIIPAWHEFVSANPGTALRGVGEPIWAERVGDELVECQAHESLLNDAFASAPAFWLLCPYDTTKLSAAVVDETRRSHPTVMSGDVSDRSPDYAATSAGVLQLPLSAPNPAASEVRFDRAGLALVRARVREAAARCGMALDDIRDIVHAVHEVATNSVRHGGGAGELRIWHDGGALVCEVRDSGFQQDALAGRKRPAAEPGDSRGMWLVNHLCDLVQMRSTEGAGCTVRLHKRVA